MRLTTSHYDDSGEQLQETRLYFDVPASLPGTDGTNYDPTLYRLRRLGPSRTAGRRPTGRSTGPFTTYSGATIEQWMGTNDSTFNGGESSGTDNMVKTEALVMTGWQRRRERLPDEANAVR